MVSVLISVYNQDPSLFVQDLLIRLKEQDKPFEILIGNDASDSKFMPIYEALEENQGVSFFHARNNLGRSKMRNSLAKLAKYPYLLFIDGDAMINSERFISAYLEKAELHTVICGGTAYHKKAPEKREELLRWKYGINREARPAATRKQNPYSSFSSFNFFLSAEVFKKIQFREDISRYGHEDTIFGIELEREGIPVIHIDNQLIHTGLDEAEVFLEKTRDGLKNLAELLYSYDHPDDLTSHIRLLKQYVKFRKRRLSPLINLIYKISGKGIRRNLTGSNPSMRLLDLYKLCVLNKIQS